MGPEAKRGVTAETVLDILGLVGLASLTVGVYLEMGLARAFMVFGGVLLAAVVGSLIRG